MPINDIHALSLEGEYCGVPISMSLAYKQLADDPIGENAGLRLIDQWFTEAGGPWLQIRPFLTEDLNIQCAVDSFGEQVATRFLDGAVGLVATPSYPSPHCVQMNVPGENPSGNADEGRFYLPGWPIVAGERSWWKATTHFELRLFALTLLEIDDLGGGQGGRYHLMPHAKYVGPDNAPDANLAFVPYANPLIKIIGNRRSDACTAFTSGAGQGGFDTIVIPPPV